MRKTPGPKARVRKPAKPARVRNDNIPDEPDREDETGQGSDEIKPLDGGA